MPWKTRYGNLAVLTYRFLIDPLIRPLRPRIVDACKHLGAGSVLDIASGTGAQCRALGRAGIHATGVDLAEAMIETACASGGENTAYVLGSATALPFDTDRFDACLFVLALHEHPEDERRTMLEEALRVLHPDGRLVIADYQKPARGSALHPAWQMIRFVEKMAGGEHHAGFRDFVERGSVRGFLERYGLQEIERIRSHFGAIEISVVSR